MKNAVLSSVAFFTFGAVAAAQEKPEPPRINETNLIEMEKLVEQGADPNAPIRYSRLLLEGETRPPDSLGSFFPLDAAIATQQSNLVKRLLALGAKPRGNELADIAFKSHGSTSVAIAKMLLQAGVDPNSTDYIHYGPALNAAAFRGNLKLMELLLAQPKINVNLQDIDGRTALMPASKGGHLEIVEALLEAGADPNIKNRRGQTAAAEAQAEIDRRGEIVSRLKNTVASRWTGHWKVVHSNGIDQVHDLRKDGTAFVSEPLRSSPGRATVKGDSVVISFEDDRIEKWRSVGDQLVVEHWNPISEKGIATPALGIAERTAATR